MRTARATHVVLAIDVGTSSTRAGLFDRDGNLLPQSEHAETYVPHTTPDGGAEFPAGWLLERTARAVDAALQALRPRASTTGRAATLGSAATTDGAATAGGASKSGGAAKSDGALTAAAVAAVGISTFWHSLVGIAEDGAAVTPVYIWADTRSGSEIPELRRRLGSAAACAQFQQRTGAPLHPTFWPAKLLWLQHRLGRQFGCAKQWVSFGEYLQWQLFGASHASVSMASATGLWDHARADWDGAGLRLIGVARARMDAVSDEPQHGLRARWARRWPILRDVPWFPAWGDGACANAGSGATAPNQMALTIGTSSALRTIIPATARFHLADSLWRYALDRDRHIIGGALSEGGNVHRWALDTFRITAAGEPDLTKRRVHPIGAELSAAETRRLAKLPPDGHGLTLLPFLAGERSPGWHAQARATLTGLSIATSPLSILQAGMEAVAFRLAAIHDELRSALGEAGFRARRFEILAGGAALHYSELWRQMVADALNAPITATTVPESSARGAALLAWERLGAIDLASAPAPRGEVRRPRAAVVPIYAAARERQQHLYSLLEKWPE